MAVKGETDSTEAAAALSAMAVRLEMAPASPSDFMQASLLENGFATLELVSLRSSMTHIPDRMFYYRLRSE